MQEKSIVFIEVYGESRRCIMSIAFFTILISRKFFTLQNLSYILIIL